MCSCGCSKSLAAYENAEVDFITGQGGERSELNPNGIPCCRTNLVLWESLATTSPARKYDKGFWPKSVEDEGRTFQWSVWAMTEAEEPPSPPDVHVLSPEQQRKKAEDAAERFKKPLGVLDGWLAGRDYLLGSAFSVPISTSRARSAGHPGAALFARAQGARGSIAARPAGARAPSGPDRPSPGPAGHACTLRCADR